MVSRKRRASVLKHPLETARGEMGPRQVLWNVRQAEAGKRCFQHRDRAIEDELPIDVNVQFADVLLELPPTRTGPRVSAGAG
ncbi:MAG: hypothetical protein WCA32_08995 [Chromatiaceae bacterium]